MTLIQIVFILICTVQNIVLDWVEGSSYLPFISDQPSSWDARQW